MTTYLEDDNSDKELLGSRSDLCKELLDTNGTRSDMNATNIAIQNAQFFNCNTSNYMPEPDFSDAVRINKIHQPSLIFLTLYYIFV